MKKLLGKIALTTLSCVFFVIAVPILLTTAQNNLFFMGFAILFVFFGICLYLLMTSPFFKTEEELAMKKQAMESLK